MSRRSNLSDRSVVMLTVAGLIVALVACLFIANLFVQGASALVPLAAGILLLVGNVRELASFWKLRQPSKAIFNGMIGLALVLFGLGTGVPGSVFKFLFYGPAVGLLLLALPMALGRSSIYGTYGQWIRRAVGSARGVVGGRQASTDPNVYDTRPVERTVEVRPSDFDMLGGQTQVDERRQR